MEKNYIFRVIVVTQKPGVAPFLVTQKHGAAPYLILVFKRRKVASITSLIGLSVLNTLWKQAQKRELMQTQKKKVVCIDEQGPQTSFADPKNYFGSRQDQKGPSRTNKFQQKLGLVKSNQINFICTNVQALKLCLYMNTSQIISSRNSWGPIYAVGPKKN